MLKWAPYPFLRVAIFLSAGILSYLKWGLKPGICLPLLAFFSIFFLVIRVLLNRYKSVDLNNLAGLLALMCFFFTGALLTHYRTAETRSHNLRHVKEPIFAYKGKVVDYIIHKPSTVSSTLAVTRVQTSGGWKPVTGKVRLTLASNLKIPEIYYGNELVIKGSSELVKFPLNPGQFNFQQYLANQQIYHQHYLQPDQYLTAGHTVRFSVIEMSIQIRNYLDKQLRSHITSTRAYAVATALVLGIKDHLPDDIKSTYANTGTMHVLAVSGLHVALLFQMLSLLIGRWGKGRRYRLIIFFILLSFIWGYGFITALSPSVMRAVVMFTIILIADTFKKQTNIYNTLAAAAFFLLLYNPYYLLDVGFQLSFLAVFGIVYFQPVFYRWLEFNAQTVDFLWKLTTTSLAAQLAVLPLSFYYFHQFPVYFLLANIPAIILSEFALLTGFMLLLFGWWEVVGRFFGMLLEGTLDLMNACSEWLLTLPLSVINGISISGVQTWCLYFLMVFLILFFARRRLVYFGLFTVLLLGFSGWRLVEKHTRTKQQLLVFYQVPRALAFGFINGQKATLLADSTFYSQPKYGQYSVQPHWINLHIKHARFDTLCAQPATRSGIATVSLPDGNLLVSYQGQRILVAQKPIAKYALDNFNLDYLVLTRNALVLPQTLPVNKGKIKVILAGSNFKRYKTKIRTLFSERAIPVYDLQETGAFVFSDLKTTARFAVK